MSLDPAVLTERTRPAHCQCETVKFTMRLDDTRKKRNSRCVRLAWAKILSVTNIYLSIEQPGIALR
jgi:hypothetical protein